MPRLKRLAFNDLPPSPTPFHFYSQLTVRERRFVDVYVARLDPQQAARSAGYGRPDAYKELLDDERVRCAIRERSDAVSELAGITAADLRRDLKLINDADATELSGVHKVPCRHCHGASGQFQFTDAELIYLEQAHSYGEQKWPMACVTSEYGGEIFVHARAAYEAGKRHMDFNSKGGGGYSRNREINPDCPQCHGQGTPMVYVCDTRSLSDGARRVFRGIRLSDTKLEVMTIDRGHVREMLARDLRVGVERKELVVSLPRSPQEFRETLDKMSTRELEEFVTNVVTLTEGEYAAVDAGTSLPAPARMTRGN